MAGSAAVTHQDISVESEQSRREDGYFGNKENFLSAWQRDCDPSKGLDIWYLCDCQRALSPNHIASKKNVQCSIGWSSLPRLPYRAGERLLGCRRSSRLQQTTASVFRSRESEGHSGCHSYGRAPGKRAISGDAGEWTEWTVSDFPGWPHPVARVTAESRHSVDRGGDGSDTSALRISSEAPSSPHSAGRTSWRERYCFRKREKWRSFRHGLQSAEPSKISSHDGRRQVARKISTHDGLAAASLVAKLRAWHDPDMGSGGGGPHRHDVDENDFQPRQR
mmetsp:Transcript_30959/g.57980  ORF Transcript_30959/g.57980 Transcript_30959/m.57980 type:complete len:278 (+) Transcript_30959:1254-2087(+)